MCEYFPDLSRSFDRDNPEGNHYGWQSYDDPFEPLPADQQPPSDDIMLSDEELNAMLPLLLNHQDQEDFRRVNSVTDELAFKNNSLASSSHHCKSNSAAPKNTRNGRPAKRPLDGYSAFVRHERTQLISSINSNEKLHEPEAIWKTLNKKIKHFNSAKPTTPSKVASLQEPGEERSPFSKYHLAVDGQDSSHVESGIVPLKIKTTPVADPLSYEILQSYKTLDCLPTITPGEQTQPGKEKEIQEFPNPRWHWHDSSKPMDIPPSRYVTVNDSNGIPQTYNLAYAAITMPYDVANKLDPMALYESTKEVLESYFNNRRGNVVH
jgi:hypothetical protein